MSRKKQGIKLITLFSLNFLFVSQPVFCISSSLLYHNNDSSIVISIQVYPEKPLIEKDDDDQYLNFDLVIKNMGSHTLELNCIEVTVFDKQDKLVLRKFVNRNGRAPSIDLVGKTVLLPGETIQIFNPFFYFAASVPVQTLQYRFLFCNADNKAQQNANTHRLPLDYDISVSKIITPLHYLPKTKLNLPLKGKLIVWDGHDFFSHHRRFPVGVPVNNTPGILANSNRYAYDFISVDDIGNMYNGSPFKKENWYVFNKPIYAPASGKIIAVENTIPDNSFNGANIIPPELPAGADSLGMGNYVIIDHENGEYSILLHMEKGSVKVKMGEDILAGELIGNVGFSGDAICPHLHYTMMCGPHELLNEGVPSIFYNYYLLLGSKIQYIKKGRIDSGDILESAKY